MHRSFCDIGLALIAGQRRTSRIESERSQDREDHIAEILIGFDALAAIELRVIEEVYFGTFELRKQLAVQTPG